MEKALDKTPEEGACDHVQPSDVARLAEEYLAKEKIDPAIWPGSRFGYGGNGGSGPFKSVYTEIEYRAGQWVAVKLDRNKEDLPTEKRGFKVVKLGSEPI